ncbi:WSCD family member AAEL009094 [Aricia agestis]|uniref:WSCD family member AAEL009094 n=1 Tax=Aricia agestis TaxID=91739 RepID=UPI001C203EA0|nr:WSCD family member AAEL009094 [Aricia agestis]
MFRRSIFLLAFLVIVLYFSIILSMLNPLNGDKSSYYRKSYAGHLGLIRRTPTVKWCRELQWQSPPSPNVVALVSHPGSGNTWLRYLLQQATGILTGSIYMDYGLRMHGFPAENVTDGSVLVVKTHELPPADPPKFMSAVLLIRNPRDAILADFNRLHKGHIGTASKSAFRKRTEGHSRSDWETYVFNQLRIWEHLHWSWLHNFSGPVHIVFYETLVDDTQCTLGGILNFLNQTVSEEHMECTVVNKEGIYRRQKKLHNFEPFTQEMYAAIDVVKKRVQFMVQDYRKRNNCTSSH